MFFFFAKLIWCRDNLSNNSKHTKKYTITINVVLCVSCDLLKMAASKRYDMITSHKPMSFFSTTYKVKDHGPNQKFFGAFVDYNNTVVPVRS